MDDHFLEVCMREVQIQTQFALAAFQGMANEMQSMPARHEDQRARAEAISNHYSEQRDSIWKSGDIDPSLIGAKLQELSDQQSRELSELYESGSTWSVFFFAYSFLIHAANVSKLIWPGRTINRKDRDRVGNDKLASLVALRESRRNALRKALELEQKEWLIMDKALRDNLEHYDERLEAWYVSSSQRNMADWSLMSRSAISGLAAQDYRRLLDPQTLTFHMEETDSDLVAMMHEVETIHLKSKRWISGNTGPAKWEKERRRAQQARDTCSTDWMNDSPDIP